jgi:hypothetical protein
VRRERGDRLVALVWDGAREALVQHAAERVDVGARVDLLAVDLLRRDVVHGAHEDAGAGQPAHRPGVLGEAEVRQVDVVGAVLRLARHEQDVRRLDVAVDEIAPVRRGQRARDLADDRRRAIDVELLLGPQQRAQVAPLDVTHRHVEQPVSLPGVVDRDHVRVVDRAGEPRLAQEPFAERVVLQQVVGEDLQRDLAAHPDVLGEVDDRHAAARDDRLDPVTAELGADTWHLLHVRAPARR